MEQKSYHGAEPGLHGEPWQFIEWDDFKMQKLESGKVTDAFEMFTCGFGGWKYQCGRADIRTFER